MIDTHSHFVNDIDLTATPPVPAAKSVPPATTGPQKPKPKDSTDDPLKNNIYDNVNIELPPAPEEEGDFCSMDDTTSENGDDSATQGETENNVMDFVNGITKKQWIWAAAIGGGIILLKNSTN